MTKHENIHFSLRVLFFNSYLSFAAEHLHSKHFVGFFLRTILFSVRTVHPTSASIKKRFHFCSMVSISAVKLPTATSL